MRKLLLFGIFAVVALTGGLVVWNHFTGPSRHAALIRTKMDYVALSLQNPNGTRHAVLAKRADTARERHTGLGYMDASQLKNYYLWFQFKKPYTGTWKAAHVQKPLGIAWLNRSGKVVEMGRLKPGKGPAKADTPVWRALEGTARSLHALGVEKGTDIDVMKPAA